MRKTVFGLVFTLVFFFSLWALAMDEAAAAKLPDRLIRLHVLAASDSASDQADKLAVRDAVLAAVAPALQDCRSRAEAVCRVQTLLPEVETAAQSTLRSLGSAEGVTVTLSEEAYPVRSYDSFALPAGSYVSLRVAIGAGTGHNWWCVVFPPLCLAAAEEDEADAWAVFSPEEQRLITAEGRVLRLRALEWWEKLEALLR